MKDERKRRRAFMLYALAGMVLLAGLIVVFRVYAFETARVFDDSMAPTMRRGDRVLILTTAGARAGLGRGEVVWFSDPRGGDLAVKRVVALAGDTFETRDGFVFVNGKALREPYVAEPIRYFRQPMKVPAGFIVVLGDNRNFSDDSIVWGPLPMGNVRGRVARVLWPPERMGGL